MADVIDNIIVVDDGHVTSEMRNDIRTAHKAKKPLPHRARYIGLSLDSKGISPADLLAKMADTYRERNAVYGDNWRNMGNVMLSLFPGGVHLDTADKFKVWHLFELIVVKLTRFANSNMSHADSIHDIAVYAAMIEAAIKENEK